MVDASERVAVVFEVSAIGKQSQAPGSGGDRDGDEAVPEAVEEPQEPGESAAGGEGEGFRGHARHGWQLHLPAFRPTPTRRPSSSARSPHFKISPRISGCPGPQMSSPSLRNTARGPMTRTERRPSRVVSPGSGSPSPALRLSAIESPFEAESASTGAVEEAPLTLGPLAEEEPREHGRQPSALLFEPIAIEPGAASRSRLCASGNRSDGVGGTTLKPRISRPAPTLIRPRREPARCDGDYRNSS